jgi:RNA polymerase sigma factor (sigma-70 family)
MARNEDESLRTRSSLLNRIKDPGNDKGWEEFCAIYRPLIYGVARKAGLRDAEADDAAQETLLAVFNHIGNFVYDPALGSFKAWLLKMTRWRIIDQLRKRGPLAEHRRPDDMARTATVEKIPDERGMSMDAFWESDWEKNLLDAAMAKVRRRLDPQKFQLFDFYVNKEWPPEKVARTFSVSVNQVYLAKNRVTEMLRDEVRRLEKEVM